MGDTFTTSMSTFMRNVERDMKQMKEYVVDNIFAITYTVYADVMRYNPVLTGDYRLNTNISNKTRNSVAYKKSQSAPARGSQPTSKETSNCGFKQTAKEFKLGDTIYIYNDLSYANKVEFLGWAGNTAPYASFKKAEMNAPNNGYEKNVSIVKAYLGGN